MDNHFDWEHEPDLNITPLVDIMLVLLAILMVTTPALVYEESINLPEGSASALQEKVPKIEIRADRERNIYVKDDKYTLAEFADNFLLFAEGYDKNTRVYIRADENLAYRDVMFVMKSVKEAGFHKVALVTDG